MIKEERSSFISENSNESNSFEYENNFKLENEEFRDTRDVVKIFLTDSVKEASEMNTNEINSGM